MKKYYFTLIIFVLFFSACTKNPSENLIQTAIALTNEANPTETPSFTPSSTKTSTSPPTFTSTFTLTPTSTNTPIPPEQATATAFENTEQAKYLAETATRDAYLFQLTATQDTYFKQLTATKEASYATQTQTAKDAEADYATLALVYMSSYLTDLENVAYYSSLAGMYPELIFDNDWKSDMKDYLSGLTNYSYKLSTIYAVPERFSNLDELFTTLYSESYNLEVEMIRGIDYIDANAIERATTHMENIGDLADELEYELDKID